jgi:kinesin family member 11
MKILEESQSANQKQLFQLQKKFEVTFAKVVFYEFHIGLGKWICNVSVNWWHESIQVFTADEEKHLMEKVAGLLAESNARKKNMVHLFYCTLLSFLFFKTLIHPQTAFTLVPGQ